MFLQRSCSERQGQSAKQVHALNILSNRIGDVQLPVLVALRVPLPFVLYLCRVQFSLMADADNLASGMGAVIKPNVS